MNGNLVLQSIEPLSAHAAFRVMMRMAIPAGATLVPVDGEATFTVYVPCDEESPSVAEIRLAAERQVRDVISRLAATSRTTG